MYFSILLSKLFFFEFVMSLLMLVALNTILVDVLSIFMFLALHSIVMFFYFIEIIDISSVHMKYAPLNLDLQWFSQTTKTSKKSKSAANEYRIFSILEQTISKLFTQLVVGFVVVFVVLLLCCMLCLWVL